MKKIFSLVVLFGILCSGNGLAQIEVVGVGSGQPNRVNGEVPEFYLPIGGPSPSDFKIISEPSYECIYDYVISTKDKQGNPIKENYTTILQLGKTAGRFTDYSTFRRDSIPFTEKPTEKSWQEMNMEGKKLEYKFTGDILLNYPQGELTYTDIVTPVYQEYTEPFPPMEWEIKESQDTICGYICTLATGSYGGRDWEVWFTEEIPSDMGPWKFSGLPGLIMSAKDSEGVHDFKAISFREGKTPIAKPNNSVIQKTSRDKFVDTKNKFEKKPTASINPDAIEEMTVSHGRLIVNKVEIPSRPNGYTPIELN